MRMSGVNMMTTQISAAQIVLTAGPIRLDRTRKELPRKNAMKIERRTPVDLVKVLMPKKMQARRTADDCGMW